MTVTPLCDYWVREDGQPQRRCGAEATHYHASREHRTLYYCDSHTQIVRERTRDQIIPSPIRTPDMDHGTHGTHES